MVEAMSAHHGQRSSGHWLLANGSLAIANAHRRGFGIQLRRNRCTAAVIRVIGGPWVGWQTARMWLSGGALEATLDWSYDLLDLDEQQVFRTLGVFVDGFDLAAVAAVAGVSRQTATALAEALIAKSLVTRSEHRQAARFRLLETVKAYAEDRLVDAGRPPGCARHTWSTSTASPRSTGAIWVVSCDSGSGCATIALQTSLAINARIDFFPTPRAETTLRLAGVCQIILGMPTQALETVAELDAFGLAFFDGAEVRVLAHLERARSAVMRYRLELSSSA